MGTSTPFKGGNAKNPLIPSWINDIPTTPISLGTELPDKDELEIVIEPNRFFVAKNNMSRFIHSGGTERKYLNRAIKAYVGKTLGGSTTASKRMKIARSSAENIVTFFNEAHSSGIREALKKYDLDALADLPIGKIYPALVNAICGSGGDLDSSFSIEAYLDTIIEMEEQGFTDLDKPSEETILFILETFIANSIKNKLLNDIALKIVTDPESIAKAEDISKQINDFIDGAVSDAFSGFSLDIAGDALRKKIKNVYEKCYDVMEALAEMGD